jgi:hypothetical protein
MKMAIRSFTKPFFIREKLNDEVTESEGKGDNSQTWAGCSQKLNQISNIKYRHSSNLSRCLRKHIDGIFIFDSELKTLQTVIRRTEIVEDIPFHVQNHSQIQIQNENQNENQNQIVCVNVTSAVKFLCFGNIDAVMPQKPKLLHSEICQDFRKI